MMGSILSGYETVILDVEAFDPDPGDGFNTIELYGPGMTFLGEVDCAGTELCVDSFDVDVAPPTYFVLKATQDDGDWLVAAPIWFE